MEWIASFLVTYPKVRLDFVLSDELSDLIADGIDMAFRGGEQKDSSFIARRLGRANLMLAASRGYLSVRGVPVTFQELVTHDCITTGKPGRVVWRAEGPIGMETVEVRGRFGGNTTRIPDSCCAGRARRVLCAGDATCAKLPVQRVGICVT